MGLFWAAIGVGFFLFLLAVGIPYWLTHRRLRPREHEADIYLGAKDRADAGLLPDQPAPTGRAVAVGTAPVGRPREAGGTSA